MKVVVVIDSLKGSLSSIEAGEAAKAGILAANKEATVIVKPLADGGEGTTEALVCGMNGTMNSLTVTGPIYEPVEAQYGMIDEVAVIEMAQAAGLPQVPADKRNPLVTTTYGVGEMIKACVEAGCKKFIIGIGGSATNDAGIGMLMALGYKFLNQKGEEVEQGGQGLSQIVSIDDSNVLSELKSCEFKIACDVNNPLYGSEGAAHVYGPQKGATPQMVEQLDEGLRHFAHVVENYKGKDFATLPGAGAAGGLGFAFTAFLNGTLQSGVQIILEETKLEEALKGADFVLTGEGRLDHQTAMGKAPIGVAKLAKKHGCKVIGVAGSVTKEATACHAEGIDAYFSIVNGAMSLEEAMNKEVAAENMKQTTQQIFNLIQVVNK
ncbi:glycerate kinase [Turicibacter sp. TJ11]|uniref:glycerate kinase family protein n=1 Tax=Turicibacter sp. TJ11 TaxID=2806443 RepID=UPI001F425195|nr:glycerate kinase [Turicibacter sp. TJ11]